MFVTLLRQASQSDRGEEVDGKASVSGIISREKTFKERLQSPETQTHSFLIIIMVVSRRRVVQ